MLYDEIDLTVWMNAIGLYSFNSNALFFQEPESCTYIRDLELDRGLFPCSNCVRTLKYTLNKITEGHSGHPRPGEVFIQKDCSQSRDGVAPRSGIDPGMLN